MVFNFDASDPLAVVTAPPPNESPAERAAREEREAEARMISDQIDDQLRADKAILRKSDDMVKILLLGQSESGKCLSPVPRAHSPLQQASPLPSRVRPTLPLRPLADPYQTFSSSLPQSSGHANARHGGRSSTSTSSAPSTLSWTPWSVPQAQGSSSSYSSLVPSAESSKI